MTPEQQIEAMMREEHGGSIIYEDRYEIDMEVVDVDAQPCEAVNYALAHVCDRPAMYRVDGQYRERCKGARGKRFQRNLCTEHLEAWAKLHGTTIEALLNGGAA